MRGERNNNKREYEVPQIVARPSDKQQVDYEKLRKDQLKNLNNFVDNWDQNLHNDSALKKEVREYVKVT